MRRIAAALMIGLGLLIGIGMCVNSQRKNEVVDAGVVLALIICGLGWGRFGTNSNEPK